MPIEFLAKKKQIHKQNGCGATCFQRRLAGGITYSHLIAHRRLVLISFRFYYTYPVLVLNLTIAKYPYMVFLSTPWWGRALPTTSTTTTMFIWLKSSEYNYVVPKRGNANKAKMQLKESHKDETSAAKHAQH